MEQLAKIRVTLAQRRRLVDLVVLIWIGWFAWQNFGFMLRDDLYLYGDHPGQFYRLWQLAEVVWPEQGQLIGWSPYWHAGWVELQFYPPGAALAGWLIWMLSLQQLSLFLSYQTIVFLSFILPAIGLYLLMAWGLNDRLAGVAAAWLVMTLPYPLGGALGVIIGMIGYRLALGLVPLLILTTLWLIKAEQKTLPWLMSGLLLGAIILLHPYQLILPVIIIGLYALLRGHGWQLRLRWLAYTISLGFGLTAFWWLPLGVRRHLFVPIVEAPLLEIQSNLHNMWFAGWGLLLAAALLGSLSRRGVRRWLPLAILSAGAGLLGLVFFSYNVLIEQFNLVILDPVRLIGGITFALIAGVAIGLSELAWLPTRLLRRWSLEPLGWPLLIIVPWLVFSQVNAKYDFDKWMEKWRPTPERTPIFLNEAAATYDLPAVWEAMADTPGRVLFTSHYALLFDVPTSLKSATPFLAGKEIVGGTFTLRTPIMSYLWSGRIDSSILRGKIEQQDDKTLAGVAWEVMSDDFFVELVRQFNVTLIATTPFDVKAQAFLNASPRFEPVWSNRLFALYSVADDEPAWVEASKASVVASTNDPTAIDVQIADAAPGATLLVKAAHYPLWRAEAGGRALPIQTNAYGLMTVSLPPGSYTVHLRYAPGWAEWGSQAISLAMLVLAVGIVLLARFRSNRVKPAQDQS